MKGFATLLDVWPGARPSPHHDPPPPVYCAGTGKIRHPTRRDARRHLDLLLLADTDVTDRRLQDYRCRMCLGYHVGHE